MFSRGVNFTISAAKYEKKKGIILRVLNFILVFKKSELFENLIFLDKLEQAMCEILIKITVASQPKIQNGTYH